MAGTSWTDRLNVVVNVVVLVFIGFVLFRPGGVAATQFGKHRTESSTRQAITTAWPRLVQGARPLPPPSAPGASGRVVVEFSDYECPFCRTAHTSLEKTLAEAGGATLVYRHLPLSSIHPQADPAARAAVCSERQGRFTEMHRHLFETEGWRKDPDWGREALAVGITDTASFRTCLKDTATSRRLAEDRLMAERLGIKATPTFVSVGGTHMGVPTAEHLRKIMDR
jgi:protein-disulfide isomerase